MNECFTCSVSRFFPLLQHSTTFQRDLYWCIQQQWMQFTEVDCCYGRKTKMDQYHVMTWQVYCYEKMYFTLLYMTNLSHYNNNFTVVYCCLYCENFVIMTHYSITLERFMTYKQEIVLTCKAFDITRRFSHLVTYSKLIT